MSTATTGLSLYDATAEATASGVIRRYSTSFGLASRLLGGGFHCVTLDTVREGSCEDYF